MLGKNQALGLAFVASVGLVLLTLGIIAGTRRENVEAKVGCDSSAAELEVFWNDESRGRLLEAFDGSEQPFAEEAKSGVLRHFDLRAGRWKAAARAACIDQNRSLGSAETAERRHLCLQRRLVEWRALYEQLVRDSETQAMAASLSADAQMMALDLPSVDRCNAIETEAKDRALPPAGADEESGASALRSFEEAVAGEGSIERALALAAVADAVISEIGDPPDWRRRWHVAEAKRLKARGHLKASWTHLGRAWQLARAHRHDELIVANILRERGWNLWRRTQSPEARKLLEQALYIWKGAHGESHPQVAFAYGELGRWAMQANEPELALRNTDEALSRWDALPGFPRSNQAIVHATKLWAQYQLQQPPARASVSALEDFMARDAAAKKPGLERALAHVGLACASLGGTSDSWVADQASRKALELLTDVADAAWLADEIERFREKNF